MQRLSAAVLWILFFLAVHHPAAAEPLIFSATGCGPYKPAEEPLLEQYVQLVNGDGQSEFLVHLGDVVSGSKKAWPEEQYEKVAGILKKSRVPVFVVMGDNEWNDLDRPDEGWKFWNKHFLHFEKNFSGCPKVSKQEERPENFAFVSKGVLLIGINLVGGKVHDPAEWKKRHQQDADWVKANLEKNRNQVRAAVIFAQALPNKTHLDFTQNLAQSAKTFGKPLLFLHADGHVWQVENPWMVPNVMRVMTDQVSKAPPVLVTVTEDEKEPFRFARRLPKK